MQGTSGRNAADDIKTMQNFVVNSIPGVELAKTASGYVKKTTGFVAGKAVEYVARAKGVSPELSRALGRELREAIADENQKNKNKPKPKPQNYTKTNNKGSGKGTGNGTGGGNGGKTKKKPAKKKPKKNP